MEKSLIRTLTLFRFSGVGAAADELELECGLFLLWAPFALLTLEEEVEEEEVAGGGGARVRWEDDEEDDEWDGRLCDDDDGFFFFLTGIGASYVRKDSKDMVGVSKSSSNSLGGYSFGARGRPGQIVADEVNYGKSWLSLRGIISLTVLKTSTFTVWGWCVIKIRNLEVQS